MKQLPEQLFEKKNPEKLLEQFPEELVKNRERTFDVFLEECPEGLLDIFFEDTVLRTLLETLEHMKGLLKKSHHVLKFSAEIPKGTVGIIFEETYEFPIKFLWRISTHSI